MIEPLGARVSVIDPPVPDDKLILPEGVKGYPTTRGIVDAVGDDVELNIAVGDTVYYWNGQATEVFGTKIIGEEALVAIERNDRG